jgi:catechol 2,3-dioxygenase-like lactoylglutathione lyase family enzyme
MSSPVAIESLSAVTLAVTDMAKSVRFYDTLGFIAVYGGHESEFTSYRAGTGFLNLQLDPGGAHSAHGWGRPIFYVSDVDALHTIAMDAGYHPTTKPADAPWGERFFHLNDPDGHELSFARPFGSQEG